MALRTIMSTMDWLKIDTCFFIRLNQGPQARLKNLPDQGGNEYFHDQAEQHAGNRKIYAGTGILQQLREDERDGQDGGKIGQHADKEAQGNIAESDGGHYRAGGDSHRGNADDQGAQGNVGRCLEKQPGQEIGDGWKQEKGRQQGSQEHPHILELFQNIGCVQGEPGDQKPHKDENVQDFVGFYEQSHPGKIKCRQDHDGDTYEKPVFT